MTKFETQEANLEHEGTPKNDWTSMLTEVNTIDDRLAEMQELEEIERIEEEAGIKSSPTIDAQENMSGSFMSESIYGKLNSPQARRRRAMSMYRLVTELIIGRIGTPVLQKHLGHGTNIRVSTFRIH